MTRQQAIALKRVSIDTPRLSGSINLTGARHDLLKDYRAVVRTHPDRLLNPALLPDGYAEIGFIGAAAAGSLPGRIQSGLALGAKR